MKLTYLPTLVIVAIIAGCTTPPAPEIQYYLLSSDDAALPVTARTQKSVLGIAPVTVADYINTDGLALLSNQNQLRIARHHRWAEKPEHAIARTLQTDLTTLLPDVRVDNAQESHSQQWNTRLRLHIDQLHGTEAGEAIISGFWRLDHPETDNVIASQRFLLRQPLEKPGYGEMVKTLRALLHQLSNQLASQLSTSPAL
ncbi:MAG: ABC-type transport auxiliary lipoprotein family protein [Marinobacterium sp.]|nr:ABC-type transport auxiliary lipoprotein family protein [Marinobacterium sp.]